MQPVRRQTTTPDTDLVWSAEMYADNDTLLGGFKIEHGLHQRRGLLNLQHHSDTIHGTWIRVALSRSSTGKVALARSVDDAIQRVQHLLAVD